jgi:nitrite reductase/ring-hydroxylating ferredoxin subunit
MPFVHVCSEKELAAGQIVRVKTATPIALCNVDGEFFAISDYCSHERSSFSEEGYLDGDEVECGWHCARFSVRTGEVTMPPATKPIQTFQVRMEGSDIFVLTPDD